jgi:hypothetical protein
MPTINIILAEDIPNQNKDLLHIKISGDIVKELKILREHIRINIAINAQQRTTPSRCV